MTQNLVPLTKLPAVGELVYYPQTFEDGSPAPTAVYRVVSPLEAEALGARDRGGVGMLIPSTADYDDVETIRYFQAANDPKGPVSCAIMRFGSAGKYEYNSLFKVVAP